jgi:hypothetical protein
MSLRMRKLHGHKEKLALCCAVLCCAMLCDATAYVEVCLPSRCLETGCITPLSYYCLRVLLSNDCFCGSAVRAWSKYAKINVSFKYSFINTFIHRYIHTYIHTYMHTRIYLKLYIHTSIHTLYRSIRTYMTVAEAQRSKTWTVFDRSESMTAGSNPALGAWMFNGVYMCFPVFVLSCV